MLKYKKKNKFDSLTLFLHKNLKYKTYSNTRCIFKNILTSSIKKLYFYSFLIHSQKYCIFFGHKSHNFYSRFNNLFIKKITLYLQCGIHSPFILQLLLFIKICITKNNASLLCGHL